MKFKSSCNSNQMLSNNAYDIFNKHIWIDHKRDSRKILHMEGIKWHRQFIVTLLLLLVLTLCYIPEQNIHPRHYSEVSSQ